MALKGGCRCGAVRYTVALDALQPIYACHCHQCQKWTGSAFSLQMLLPEALLSVEGPVATYEKVTGERTSTQRVCAVCHARIYNSNTRRPAIVVVRAGTLDRSEELDCVGHIFTAYRQRWLPLPEDVASWPEAPALADLAALLQRQGRA